MVTNDRYHETLDVIDDLLELVDGLNARIFEIEHERGESSDAVCDVRDRINSLRTRVRAIVDREKGHDDAQR